METFYNITISNPDIALPDTTTGSIIAYHRQLNKLTQIDLANILNLNISTIRRYELNILTPSKKVISKLNHLFNISL